MKSNEQGGDRAVPVIERRDGAVALNGIEAAGEATDALHGQAQEAVTVSQPAPGETIVVQAVSGAVYLLDFAPEAARFLVEGENIVMTFDVDGDGTVDSRIVFLDLAGMAGQPDAPHLLIAGVDYGASALIEGAETFMQAQGLPEAAPAELPAGAPVETADGAGGDGAAAQSGGSSSYQDDFGSTPFSSASQTLADVGGPLGADFTPGGGSGTVITGLPRLTTAGGKSATLPDSGGGTGGTGGDGGGVETIAGQVVDGYVANATVFRDANNNGVLDDGEVSTTTDIDGNFTLAGGSGPLIAIGGTDVSTGLAFDGVLKAPEGSTVITPLTTLVQQLVESGQTAAAAETQVKQALGIDASFNLKATDPVKAAASGDAAALKAVKAGIAVANTATQVKAALAGAGTSNSETASNAAFKAIANKINNSGAATNLKDSSQVADVLNDAATNSGAVFNNNDVANAAKVITATNTAVENVDTSGGGSATEALTNLAKVAQVAQSGAATAIQNAVQNDADNDVDNYDDAAKVETEADTAEVGDVDGSDALTAGDDNFTGTAAGDAIDGLAGNDTLDGAGGADAISGGAGNDLIIGGAGNDVLSGGTGNDTLLGGEGNDDIIGNAGSDVIDGGDGIDIVRFEGNAAGYSLVIDDGSLRVTHLASGAVDTLTNVESLRFADGKTLTLTSGTLDISKLGAVSVTFASLDNITQITTAASQSITLDGTQIDAISQADGTFTIAGGAAVNVINAGLTVSPDGSAAPSVVNLLALEFVGLDGAKSLIPDNLTIDGSHTAAFAAFWIPLDQLYVGSGDYYDLTINTSFAYLGNDYASYLAAGGTALLDLVKVPSGRLQTLHDNLLGNLGDGPIQSRFINQSQPDPRTDDGKSFGDRPYHDGSVDGGGLYDDPDLAAAVIAWDIAHGVAYPDSLPAPYAVLDDVDRYTGTAADELFFGGGGDDTIAGGDGDDGAAYLGSRLDFDVVGNADGDLLVTDTAGSQGSDSLTGVETLYFADGTLRFGATLAHAVPENDGGGTDGFHPGSGLNADNFVIHDNTDLGIEAGIKAIARYHGDLESDGQTYYAQLGFSDRDGDGLADENSDVGYWNFNYSVVDYGNADLSAYDIAITADFTDYDGNVTEGVLNYDPFVHDAAVGEDYYQDPTGETDGTQNSQNPSWSSPTYNATIPGTYTVTLTVTDKESGEVVAQTQMQVVVKADITVGDGGDYATIQEAIDAASDGDTIFVMPGTYAETVVIDKLVKLYGAKGDINGDAAGRGTGETVIAGGIYLQNGSDGSTIDGFTIQNGAVIAGSPCGIYLQDASDIIIENNVFDRDGGFDGYRAILTTSGGANGGLLVSDNAFSGWATGVYLNPGAADAEIDGNLFTGNNVGVSIDGPDGAVVSGNSFVGSVFEHLGLGPGTADPTVTLTGNDFGDGVRAVGIYDDGIVVTGELPDDAVALELQSGALGIALLGEADFAVIGNDADNVIIGNSGDNVLQGGIGNDTLVGGDGADLFVFTDNLEAGDLIDGFDGAAGDRIDLDGLLDALGIAAADRSARVDIQQAAPGADATISVDSDPAGDGFELVVATVTNVSGELTAEHLVLATV